MTFDEYAIIGSNVHISADKLDDVRRDLSKVVGDDVESIEDAITDYGSTAIAIEWKGEPEKSDIEGFYSEDDLGLYDEDKELFGALAKYVDGEGYIECEGQDFSHWRWSYRDGAMKEYSGYVVYEDDIRTIKDLLRNYEEKFGKVAD